VTSGVIRKGATKVAIGAREGGARTVTCDSSKAKGLRTLAIKTWCIVRVARGDHAVQG